MGHSRDEKSCKSFRFVLSCFGSGIYDSLTLHLLTCVDTSTTGLTVEEKDKRYNRTPRGETST